jgi:protein-S-isoprenylcysteine O-methyltransferase Ste14
MNTNEVSLGEHPGRVRLPPWAVSIYLSAFFLLVHVAAPWRLSLLSNRHGWVKGRPGRWNLLALLLVIPGIAGTCWMIALHYRASPRSFVELKQTEKLLTPGPYALSRNPMYLFELVFWFGWALFYGSFAVLIGFLVFFTLLNFVIVPYEERGLEARFGEAYRQYKNSVPRWLGKTQP